MKTKMVTIVAPLLALLIFSCEKQGLNPATNQKSGKDVQNTEVLTMPGGEKYNAARIGNDDNASEAPQCIILPELPDWPTAFFVMEQAAIQGDIITFTLSFPGGCRLHNFQLVCTTFEDLKPLQVSAQIFHNNNDDPCERWVTEVREFDLSPLKELYFKTYDTPCGTIIINLVDDLSQNSPVTYNFCDDDGTVPTEPLLPQE